MLSTDERLKLQQLRLLEWAEERGAESPASDVEADEHVEAHAKERALTAEVDLHPWQRAAVDAWFDAGRRGTIKVVTGAGKTLAALAIVDRLRREDPELRVAIVVPTVVLMDQWYEVLIGQAGLARAEVGRLGGGRKDDLSDPRRFLVGVLASARKDLPALVRRARVGESLLLIVDESHRAGAPQMSSVLETPRAYSLGLSATPERTDGSIGDDESERLWGELGGVVFELSFADAIRDGILPPFRLDHYGLSLTPAEAQRYQALTRSVNEARKQLTASSPAARKAGAGDGLMAWARRVSSRPSGKLSAVAARLVNDTTRRKQLLYRAESRGSAALTLVREEIEQRPDARVILFHESIDEVVELYERFVREDIPVVMEHSGLPPQLRSASLELFRAGTAQVVVSARSLIEGFNVPEADLGIVVASSSSSRQRIQSIGRVLRKHRGTSGEEKTSRICLLYVRDSVDEAIYEKLDWERMVGLERNHYFHWDPPARPVEQSGPPRQAIPGESEVDLEALAFGDPYPGRYEGEEYGTDRLGNVIDVDGAVALNPQSVPSAVQELRGGPGRFRVTPRKSALLVRVPVGERTVDASRSQLQLVDHPSGEQMHLAESGREGDWITLFGGRLGEAFRFPSEQESTPARSVDVEKLAPGDPYLGPLEPASELRFRQRSGGTIARRVRSGEVFAHGAASDRLLGVLRELNRSGDGITRFYVNELGHAFWRESGAARFLAALDGELEFPGTAS